MQAPTQAEESPKGEAVSLKLAEDKRKQQRNAPEAAEPAESSPKIQARSQAGESSKSAAVSFKRAEDERQQHSKSPEAAIEDIFDREWEYTRRLFSQANQLHRQAKPLIQCLSLQDIQNGIPAKVWSTEYRQWVPAWAAPQYDQLQDGCLLYTSPSPRDRQKSRMPSSA